MIHLTAEPAPILYVLTGIVCFFFHRRTFTRRAASSSFMLFCQKATHERFSSISLT